MPDAALQQARAALRSLQGDTLDAPSSVLAVLERIALYGIVERTPDPKIVRRRGLKFDPEMELERIKRANILASRVDPGPGEDPDRLSALAYASASLELGYPPEFAKRLGWDFGHFLVGTVNDPSVQANFGQLDENRFSVVFVNSGLMTFVAQASIPTTLATAVPPPPGRTASEHYALDGVRARLDLNPAPAAQLQKVLEAYLYEAQIDTPSEPPPSPTDMPRECLLNAAHRWVLGHEYGHGIADYMRDFFAMNDPQEEFFADLSATLQTSYSVTRLEGLPPQLGAGGGAFFLTCAEILDRAMSLAKTGKETPGVGDAEHPPNDSRIEAVADAFLAFIAYDPSPGGGHDLYLRTERKAVDLTDSETRGLRDSALGHARALFELWTRVRPWIREQFQAGRVVHSIWR